jgi:hypothetical protein
VAALPPDNTARLKVLYQNAVAQHAAIVRLASADDAPDAQDDFEAVTTALTSLFHFSEVVGVQLAAQGSDLFFDYAGATLLGYTWGTGAAIPDTNAQFAQFSGRSSGGRKSKVYLFGYKGVISAYRITSAEETAVANAITAINAAETSFVAIDGLPTIYKGYINVKPNDHWVHKSRRGT